MPAGGWLAETYRVHRRELLFVARSIVACPSLAEDAVHAAFARMAMLAGAPREPKLYAFRAVRNAALDLVRRQSQRREISLEEPGPADLSGSEALTPMAEMEELLGRLDNASRQTVEWHLRAGLTFREIAVMVEEPLSTVASRYRRAIERLRAECEALAWKM